MNLKKLQIIVISTYNQGKHIIDAFLFFIPGTLKSRVSRSQRISIKNGRTALCLASSSLGSVALGKYTKSGSRQMSLKVSGKRRGQSV